MAESGNAKWTVRECRQPTDLERLYRFRYSEYVEKKGLFLETADHQNRRLTDLVDGFGTNFAAFSSDGDVIGSIRLNRFDEYVQSFCISAFGILELDSAILTNGCFVTRAMVASEWRKSPVFMDLSLTAAKQMLESGLRWMLVDTAGSRKAGEEDRFISLYSSMGFKIWRSDAHLPGVGPGSVMMFDLHGAIADPNSLANLYLRSVLKSEAA